MAEKKEYTREHAKGPPTEYPVLLLRAIKDIKILNEAGDAVIHLLKVCRNNSGRDLPRVVSRTHHDGSVESCEIRVDGKEADFAIEKYITKKVTDGLSIERLAHQIKSTINLKKSKIHHGDVFRYDLIYKYNSVFTNMRIRYAEWTGFYVMLPTNSLEIIVSAPNGSTFNMGGSEVRVEGYYEIEDFQEEKRCREDFPPILMQTGSLLMWEIINPRIANTYRLYFQLEKSKKS